MVIQGGDIASGARWLLLGRRKGGGDQIERRKDGRGRCSFVPLLPAPRLIAEIVNDIP